MFYYYKMSYNQLFIFRNIYGWETGIEQQYCKIILRVFNEIPGITHMLAKQNSVSFQKHY